MENQSTSDTKNNAIPSNLELLNDYKSIAENTRKIFKHLIDDLTSKIENEKEFDTAIKSVNSAVSTIQRISSVLTRLLPLEIEVNQRIAELSTDKISENHIITSSDFELIINMVREWGLLKDDCDSIIKDLVAQHNKSMEEASNV